MKVSVIIPALNEGGSIRRAVESAWKAGAWEVLVVDGGSQDATRTLAAESNAQVFESPRGRARQQNHGASQASGEVLLFLHADNWLAADSLRQIEIALEDPAVLAGGFQQQIDEAGWLYRLLERGNASRVRRLGLAYGDQALFLRQETFAAVGGFPDVPLMEDLRLMREVRRHTKPVLLAGPLGVSARRWQKNGLLRQTFRNWMLLSAELFGTSPETLARFYPPNRDSA